MKERLGNFWVLAWRGLTLILIALFLSNLFISFENLRLFAENYYLNIKLSKARRKLFSLKKELRHLTSELYERISRYESRYSAQEAHEENEAKFQPELEFYILYLRDGDKGVLKVRRWKTFPGKVKPKTLKKS